MFADVRCASAKAEQILPVGDPGRSARSPPRTRRLWQGHPAPVRTRGDRPPRRRRHSAHGRQLLARVRLCRGSRRCKSSHRSATALAGHREIELLQVPATGEPNNPACSSHSPTALTPCSAPHPGPPTPGNDHSSQPTSLLWCRTTRRHPWCTRSSAAGTSTASPSARRQPAGRAVHRRGGSRPADRH